MAISTKQMYVTTDGKEFDTELDAKTHEAALESAAKIEEFLDAAGIAKETATGKANPVRKSAANVIAKWIAFNQD